MHHTSAEQRFLQRLHLQSVLITLRYAFCVLAALTASILPLQAQENAGSNDQQVETPTSETAPAVDAESGDSEAADSTTSGSLTLPGVALTERFAQGGLTMYVLLALSFVMVAVGAERLMRLRRANIVPDKLADNARVTWQREGPAAVGVMSDKDPSVLAASIHVLASHPHLTANEISTMAGDEVSRLMRRHMQRAYPLAIVATLSPLLGLLGTVTGMIDAFEVVAIAGSLGDASLLAAGIAKALVTTAFGLLVAIPALGLYHFFRNKAHELSLEVEEEANLLIDEWFRPQQAAAASTTVVVDEE